MKRYRMSLMVIFAVALSIFSAIQTGAEIYSVSNAPQTITVKEGDPVYIPILFVGGANEGKPVELFIWKEGNTTHQREYYSDLGWNPSPGPVLSADSMVSYAFIFWEAINNTTAVESSVFSICLDGTVDGVYTADNATCGQWAVNIEKAGTPPPITPPPTTCSLSVSPASITDSLSKSITPKQYPISASCGGQMINFEASQPAGNDWLTLVKQAPNSWNAQVASVGLSPGLHTTSITITTASGTKQIPVNITIKSLNISLPPPIQCTPSSTNLWPSPLTISALAGETKQATASLTDNCNAIVGYSAAVSGGNWLSVTPSGSGSITVTANTAGMASGQYTGSVRVVPTGSAYSSFTFNVILTIEGPCVASSAVVNPASISQNIVTGSTAGSVQVTVKDNCQTNLGFTVDDVIYTNPSAPSVSWITSPATGAGQSGTFTAAFDTANLPVGQYQGTIKVTPAGYGQVSIPVTISVTAVPQAGDVTQLQNKDIIYFNLPVYPGYKFWKYQALGTNPNNKGLQIGLADMTQYSGLGDSDLIIKYTGALTCDSAPAYTSEALLADWRAVRTYKDANGNSVYNAARDTWTPARAGDEFYYKIMSGSFEFVEIPNNRPGCYYIYVVNTLNTAETAGPPYYSLRLIVADLDGY